jgi:hypothetical protein
MDVAWLKAMIQHFQGVIDTPISSDGSESPAETSGGQASAGCQQNLQVDGQITSGRGVVMFGSSCSGGQLTCRDDVECRRCVDEVAMQEHLSIMNHEERRMNISTAIKFSTD